MANPGILRQYLEDYVVAYDAAAAKRQATPEAPEFTQAQAKQASDPTTSVAMSSATRGTDGVISQFLGRKAA